MHATLIARSDFLNQPATVPLVSIIVPVYNTAAYLKQCLDSIILPEAGLIEIVIIHDGGTDNSRDIAAEWISSNGRRIRARLYDQPNAGLSAARMTGLKYATGKFVCFLDSDDIANIDVTRSAAIHAEKHDCDVVLFRSVILDNETQKTEPFYDSWLWDRLVKEQKFRRTTLSEEPRLLRLEPNANTRVIRRDLFDKAGIEFPRGLHFEDYAPHVQEMIAASSVGLLNEIGYIYRVNRPGKITDQKDRRRFDAIKSASLALEFAQMAHLGVNAIANLALQVTRLLSWCAECTRPEDRLEFCQEVMILAARIPDECYRRAKSDFTWESCEGLILDIFRTGDAAALYRLASKVPHPAMASSRARVLDGFLRKLKFPNLRKRSNA